MVKCIVLGSLFENFALQFVFCIGIISVLGLIIWRLNKAFFKLLGYRRARKLFIPTGFIGVPIHEFGHAFFCVFFFHKITEVKWFMPNSKDGTLGFVKHSFNKKNIYQQIGNFFIGIGPLLFGSFAIILLMYLFLPNSNAVAEASKVTLGIGDGISAAVTQYFEILWAVFLAIFDFSNLINFAWWVFIIFACSVAMHMDLSFADVKGMFRGLLYIVALMLVLNLVLCLINVSWAHAVTGACLWLSVSVVSLMAIAMLLLVILVLSGLLLHGIWRIFFKTKKSKNKHSPTVVQPILQQPNEL